MMICACVLYACMYFKCVHTYDLRACMIYACVAQCVCACIMRVWLNACVHVLCECHRHISGMYYVGACIISACVSCGYMYDVWCVLVYIYALSTCRYCLHVFLW